VTQVNLLPREIRQRQTVRRRTSAIALVGGLVVAAIIGFWFLQGQRLQKLDDQLAAQQASNDAVQTQVTGLQKYADLKSSLDQRKVLLKSALTNTVRWSQVLNEVSKVQPDGMWLSTLTGTASSPSTAVAPVPGAPVTPTTGTLIGTIQFSGNSLSTPTIAMWLTRLETVKGWVNPWMSGAQLGDVSGTPVWQFTSSIDLQPRAAHGGGTP
jgi:Tfp pilus assembly protein PilN